MEAKSFDNYEIAKITANETNRITELEQAMKTESNKDIVLIAYQSKPFGEEETMV